MSLSPYERSFVLDGVDQGCRVDGRGRLDYRLMTLELGTTPQASGSSRLRLGNTDVMVAVKADIGTPPGGDPTHGRLSCSVELSASADPEYEGRGGDSLSNELSKALERTLLGASAGGAASLSHVAAGERGGGGTARHSQHGAGAALDMAALGIQKGKVCWVLQCDCLVLSNDGGVLDALSIAVKAALADCKIPKVTSVAGPNPDDPQELELDDDPEECSRLDVTGVPLIVTLYKIGTKNIIDASADEVECSASGIAVAVDSKKKIRGLTQVTAGGIYVSNKSNDASKGVSLGNLRAVLKTATDVGTKLHKKVDAYLLSAASGVVESDDEEEGDNDMEE